VNSGYSVNFGGGCYSNVPRSLYRASTECESYYEATSLDALTQVNVTFVYAGATVTGVQAIQTASITAMPTITTDSFASETYVNDYTGVVFAPVATLVHKGSDSAGSKSNTEGLARWVALGTIAALVGLR
jgi:hypothetical protein